jgi:hypothetical protein
VNIRPGDYDLEILSDAHAFSPRARATVRRGALAAPRLDGFGLLRLVFADSAGAPLEGTARIWRLDATGKEGERSLLSTNRETLLEPGPVRIQVFSSHLEKDFWKDLLIERGAVAEVRVGG